MIKPNTQVKIFFKIGTSLEGQVLSWGEEVHLLSTTGEEVVIFNPKENIILARIISNADKKSLATNQAATIVKKKWGTIDYCANLTTEDAESMMAAIFMLAEVKFADQSKEMFFVCWGYGFEASDPLSQKLLSNVPDTVYNSIASIKSRTKINTIKDLTDALKDYFNVNSNLYLNELSSLEECNLRIKTSSQEHFEENMMELCLNHLPESFVIDEDAAIYNIVAPLTTIQSNTSLTPVAQQAIEKINNRYGYPSFTTNT